MTSQARKGSAHTKLLVAMALLTIVGLWALMLPLQSTSMRRSNVTTPTSKEVIAPSNSKPAIEFREDVPLVPASVDDEELDRGLTPLPTPTAPAHERVLLDAKYGDGDDMLGMECPGPGYDGLCYPPQGFAVTPEGKLVIVDTKKERLSFFGTDGRMERSIPLAPHLVMPADVAIARDGTIAVTDTEGVQTKGSVLLNPDGTIKAELGQMGGGLMTSMYAVGNDYFATIDGMSMKVGDSGGTPNDETPGLYDQGGMVPGQIAPDGRTVVNALIHNVKAGELLVSVIKNNPPEHVFSRLYSIGGMLTVILYTQSDAMGMIYVVLYHQQSKDRWLHTLACFDGSTGDPRGHVVLPEDRLENGGEPFHNYNVLPTGGIVQQQTAEDRSTYRFFNCN